MRKLRKMGRAWGLWGRDLGNGRHGGDMGDMEEWGT